MKAENNRQPMWSIRHQRSCRHRGRDGLLRTLISLCLLALTIAQSVPADEEIVVEADPFLLRIAPKPQDFSLEKRVTILWTVENIVREFFEEKFKESRETLYIGAGITGLSLVPPDENTTTYETIKFLGGAVAFHPASSVTPTKRELQTSIKESLRQDGVKARLGMYFPGIQQVIYVPLVLGNRGFAVEEEQLEEQLSSNDNLDELSENPGAGTKPTPDKTNGIDTPTGGDRGIAGIQNSSFSGSGNSRKRTVGLSTGVALGGAIIVLLIALLIESRRRRMDQWRESGRGGTSLELEDENASKAKSQPHGVSNYYMDDEQETTLRLPRIWGVSPSQRMDARTTPGSSDMSASNEGEDILTCTSVDRRSIRNVESFEHQKRLVDTLKKEMMASNAEIHPYMQDTHLDNTEPCALSPTDLSAAALQNEVLTRPVSTWHAPSDSSFTGSGSGSGYDSPSSPLRGRMLGALQQLSLRPKDASSSSRLRSPYDPDRNEL